MSNTDKSRVAFVASYIEAALWSSCCPDDNGNDRPLDDGYELSDEARTKLESVSGAFYDEHWSKFYTLDGEEACLYVNREYTLFDQAGHDTWLTQNGHGCGFNDGDWLEPNASYLTAAARALGEITLYLGDDEIIYTM